MKIIVVIPARYGSTRFEGKVLAKDTGKYLVQHTYEQALCAKTVDKVLIATDSDEVMAACGEFGAQSVMTSEKHQSGTDRIAEAVKDQDCDIIVNLQADEPEIDPAYIDMVADLLVRDENSQMATLAAPFESAEQISDPNVVKVIVDKTGRAIYFSRSVIPYDRQSARVGSVEGYMRHLGIYAYRKDFLMQYTQMPQSFLEKTEKLEQLRVIENGYKIAISKVDRTWDGIDTQKQYTAFVERYNKKQNSAGEGS